LNQSNNESQGISIKELILKIKEFWFEAWRYWWIIALFIIAVAIFQVYAVFTSKAYYPAKLTFMVNEEEGGGLGGMAGVLGNFGLGGGGGGDYNLEKMLELIKSRKIVQNVLFNKGFASGRTDYYANHLINGYEYHQEWAEDTTGLNGLLYKHDSIPNFSRAENKALKILHTRIIGSKELGIDALLKSTISENTGIMTLSINTFDEDLSINLLETVFQEISEFYVNKTIEKQQHTFDAISTKADSLHAELNSAEYGLANFMDKNRGLYNKTDQLQRLRLEAKVKMLGAAWAKVEEQKEIAEFSLRDRTPVIQIIDLPIAPLRPAKKSLIVGILTAIILGTFLGLMFVIGRKILRDIMQS